MKRRRVGTGVRGGGGEGGGVEERDIPRGTVSYGHNNFRTQHRDYESPLGRQRKIEKNARRAGTVSPTRARERERANETDRQTDRQRFLDFEVQSA